MNCEIENQYRDKGYLSICGVDEVGLGCLAGPIVASAIILRLPEAVEVAVASGKEGRTFGIDDSKKLTATVRELLYPLILKNAEAIGIGVFTVEEINAAHREGKAPLSVGGNIARCRAVYNLCKKLGSKFPHEKMELPYFASTQVVTKPVVPDLVLVDHFTLKDKALPPSVGIIKGDAKVISIAAASVVAKVFRDRYMTSLNSNVDIYDWASNSGYGAPKHLKALKEYGPTNHHRIFMLKKYLVGATV